MKRRRAIQGLALAAANIAGLTDVSHAEILFNGQWENYLGAFYGPTGWQNGTPTGRPTGNDDWSDFMSFWSPVQRDNTWMVNTSWANDRIRLEPDPTSPRHGLVARFEVRSGDHRPPPYSGERSEMLQMLGLNHQKLPVTEESGREYYGIAIKLSSDWRAPQPESAQKGGWRWGTFMQLHSPNAFSSPPAFDFMAEDDFHISMDAGNLDRVVQDPRTGQEKHEKNDAKSFALTDGSLRLGHWVEFVLDVIWAKDATGSLTVYRRDEGEARFKNVLMLANLPTLQWDDFIPTDLAHCSTCAPDNVVHYWRIGYYRSTSPNQTNVLWLGPFVRGKNFDEVATAAFGSTGPRK